MNKKNDLQKKEQLIIIGVCIGVVALIGLSYAFFRHSKTNEALILTSGGMEAKFTAGTNSIKFLNAYPINDSFAINNLEKLTYIDFELNTLSNNIAEIAYEIYLTDVGTFDTNFIKLYLTDENDSRLIGPLSLGTLEMASNDSDGHVIFKEIVSGEYHQKYRLYIWLDSAYEQNIQKESFNCKVNLYAYNINRNEIE